MSLGSTFYLILLRYIWHELLTKSLIVSKEELRSDKQKQYRATAGVDRTKCTGGWEKGPEHRDLTMISEGLHVTFHDAIIGGFVLGLERLHLILRTPGRLLWPGIYFHTLPYMVPEHLMPSVWAQP